ncbi:spermidine synthase [Acaricomes phytoseiuli]|uniref:spermidine synthase n=1 Tax=Acaricomes phytoseiuli TaxID=291968 RepID=UPI00036DD2A7|nr:fused MFS/spermidine synthase [Acaricomes phytoseiuli]
MREPQRMLSDSGLLARIVPDELSGGSVLEIGGAEQSHVDLAQPARLQYEYLHRIGALLDAFRPAGEAVSVLHLGAGALTLARQIAVTRPGSQQTAIERERELPGFVLEYLPLPAGTQLDMLVGDVRSDLEAAKGNGTRRFDAIVLDIFSGLPVPEELIAPEYFAELAALLAAGGVLVVNIGDDPGLPLVKLIQQSAGQVFPATALFGNQQMFSGRYPGNLIFAAVEPGTRRWPAAWTEQLNQAGPHPAQLLSGMELEDFCR